MNQINESNPRTTPKRSKTTPKALPRGPKSSPRPPQDGPKALQDPPKRAQEPPRAAQDPPQTTQEPPQEPSWEGLGANLGPSDHKIENQSRRYKSMVGKVLGSILEPETVAKTTQRRPPNESKIKTKHASQFFISLGLVLVHRS